MRIFLILFLFNTYAIAQEKSSTKISIGYGIGMKKNLRKDNTYEDSDKSILIKNIPLVQGSVGRFSLGPQGLSFIVLGNRFANISAFINRGGDRYHGAGMTPRKDSFFSGLSGKFMKYGLNVAKDINGKSKAFIVNANYTEIFLLEENLILRLGVGLEWYDDRYAEYYYGVRSHETTANRTEYHPHNYFQPAIGLFPIYKISENFSTTFGVTAKYVAAKIRQSPTMNGDKMEYGGLIGISYSL